MRGWPRKAIGTLPKRVLVCDNRDTRKRRKQQCEDAEPRENGGMAQVRANDGIDNRVRDAEG